MLLENKFITFGPGNFDSTRKKVVRESIKEGDCIYITVNKPKDILVKELRNKVDVKKIFFMDLVSKTNLFSETSTCIFLPFPEDLLGLAIKVMKKVEDGKFKTVILDSFSTLLLYNGVDRTIKFIHYLVNKLNVRNIPLIVISLEINREIKSQLFQFFKYV